MFLLQYARRERVLVVVGQHRHRGLDHDGAVVERGGDEVDAAAMQPDAVLDRATMGVCSWIGGQQGRVNIQYPSGKPCDEPFGQYAHETGKYNQIRPITLDPVCKRGIETFTIRIVAMVYHRRRQAP